MGGRKGLGLGYRDATALSTRSESMSARSIYVILAAIF